MKTNSNSYTITYSVVLVLIVAFLLALTFQALKPAQDANVALDKQKQILYALNIRGLNNEAAAQKYKEVVISDDIIGEDGQVKESGELTCVDGSSTFFSTAKAMDVWLSPANRCLPWNFSCHAWSSLMADPRPAVSLSWLK